MIQRILPIIVMAVLACWSEAPGIAQDQGKAGIHEALKQKGYKLAGDVVVALEEAEVEKSLRAVKTSYKTVMDARQRLNAVEQLAENNRKAIEQLATKRLQLGRMMESVQARNNISYRNSLVVQYNACADEMQMRITTDQKGEALSKAKEAYSTPRNAYMKSVLALRDLIEKTDARYKTASQDSSLETLIASAGKIEGKKLTLGPSKTYQQNVKEFERYEAAIMSDSIPMERRGGTYQIDVILNGKAPMKMIFDTGASTISLSHDMAVKAGLKPTEDTPEVSVRIANGRTVKGRLMKLDSVRVGKFEIKNVECIVMPEELPDSPALLGGAFLNNFKYEVDADAKKLRLSKVDGNSTSNSKSRK